MPYRPTGRPPGRPRIHPIADAIRDREQRAAAARALAGHHQSISDAMILAELATGKTYRQLAAELGVTIGHLRTAMRRSKRLEERKS